MSFKGYRNNKRDKYECFKGQRSLSVELYHFKAMKDLYLGRPKQFIPTVSIFTITDRLT